MSFAFYLIICIFIFGYACIALEYPLKINKAASALMMCFLLWSIFALSGVGAMSPAVADALGTGDFHDFLSDNITHHLGETGETVFFLLGAMTIVEVIDRWGGFRIITDRINATSKVELLWILGGLAFFLSAILDNLTTTIMMITLLNKLIPEKNDRWFFASMIVIAANAGGAWTPIGDVTTIMLWVAGKVSALNIMQMTVLPSIVSILVPFAILSYTLRGGHITPHSGEGIVDDSPASRVPDHQRKIVLCLGVGVLICVPVFKSITHLPPYIGILGALGIVWMVTELMRPKDPAERNYHSLKLSHILRRVDLSSIIFFLGILMAVGVLQVCGHLTMLANSLDQIAIAEPYKYFTIDTIIGVLSSIVDNVPLVAATMGMYDFAMDHYFWEMLAYCAGTGGSILIIGSAAGVAAMGIEKIDFIWYFKHITWIALIGYLAGALTYVGQYLIIHG
ncbi:MAG: sodium:proton antiporter NhaD [Bacteroidaceae bacterium]|nr:sodium:proton antiporter NhaD [Bacteroidaceae bacterium]MBR1541378.1 sodium:proton antiporter NhaD [Bacteroidaceae bacterium]